jgi:lambda family phage minor tail protein L
VIELFDLDLSPVGGGTYFFHPYDADSIDYLGNNYTHIPIDTEGFELTSRGLPTPKITVSNVLGFISGLIRDYDGLQGGKVTRTKLKQEVPPYNYLSTDVLGIPEIYLIDRATNETRLTVTFELRSIFDLSSMKLPRRTIIQNTCPYVYKSAECGYIGILPTCDRTVTACKSHFQSMTGDPKPILNFGGFVGVDKYNQ